MPAPLYHTFTQKDHSSSIKSFSSKEKHTKTIHYSLLTIHSKIGFAVFRVCRSHIVHAFSLSLSLF